MPVAFHQSKQVAEQAYLCWNDWLIRRLFPEGRPAAIVYLEVHDRLLDEAAEEFGGVGSSGLSTFIEALLGLAGGDGRLVFSVLSDMTCEWRRAGRPGDPPFVAGLGLAVLAASEMKTDRSSNVTRANFYFRLNELLRLTPAKRDQPKDFEHTVEMWGDLRDWLIANRRGRLVVNGLEGARRFVDPAKSQCLVRVCDIQELAVVAEQAGWAPGIDIDPSDLAPFMARWIRAEGSRSRLSALVGRDPHPEILLSAAGALSDKLEEWTPSVGSNLNVTSTRVQAVLQAEPHELRGWRGGQWTVGVPVDPEADENSIIINVGSEEMRADLDFFEPPRYVAPLTLDQVAKLLSGEVNLYSEGREIKLRCSTPLWLGPSPSASRCDTWEPMRAPVLDAAHQLVFKAQEFDELAGVYGNFLVETDIIFGSPLAWPGPDLVAIVGARLVARSELPKGIDIVVRRRVLRLFGGMLVSHSVYLIGGLPKILVEHGQRVAVIREDGGEVLGEVAEGSLRDLDLDEGSYFLRSGEAEGKFAVTKPRWTELRAPEDQAQPDWRDSLHSGDMRGACLVDGISYEVTHLEPGRRYTAQAEKLCKGRVPSDEGIRELVSSTRLSVVMTGAVPPAPPLMPHPDLSFSPSAGCSDFYDNKGAFAGQLLFYISARGHGPLERLRLHCLQLAARGEPWHRVLSLYEALGHIDVNWRERRWTVAPPALCHISETTTAFLAGLRSYDLVERLQDIPGVELLRMPLDPSRHPMPERLLVSGDLAAVAKALELETCDEAIAECLAVRLRPIGDMGWWVGERSQLPSRRQSFQRWNPADLRWNSLDGRLIALPDSDPPQLLRWQEMGTWKLVWWSSGSSLRVRDPSAAKWFLGMGQGEALLRYSSGEKTLAVPLALGLPRQYYRAAVLASGLSPATRGRIESYGSVSLKLARMLAVRLGQTRAQGLW